MFSQQEDWDAKRKSRTQQKDLPTGGFPTGRLTPQQQITNQTRRLAPERRLIEKMSYQHEDWHPNRTSRSQQKDLPQKEGSLRKRLPNRKTDTQTANQKPNRNSCPRKEAHYENAFPTERLTPKWNITNPTGRLAGERRRVEKMPSQQQGWHPNSKAQTKREDLHQKEESLRKCLTNRKTDTQTGHHETNRKTCPRKKAH